MIDQVGKGALPDSPDERDYKAEEVMGAPVIDWTQEFRLPEPPNEDQGTSDSCVSQAWSYYHWQLKGKDFSRRDLFSRIALSYGAAIRDGGLAIKNQGQATRDEVADPHPETAQNMRDKTGVTADKEASDQELDAYVLPNQQLDYLAAAIKDYKGFVFGVTGTNAGWHDMKNPTPPSYGEGETWGHALYAMGYHTHTNPDGSKQRCIIAKSSWSYVNEHHIKENYFFSGNTFNAWVLIPKQIKYVKRNEQFWQINPDGSMEVVTDEAALAKLYANQLPYEVRE